MILTSIRSRLTFYSLGITIVVLTLLASVSYVLLSGLVKSNNIETTYHSARITMDNVDRDITTLKNMLIWFSLNAEVNAFVNPGQKDFRLKQRSLDAYDVIKSSSYGSGLSDYINKLIVSDLRGNSIQLGKVNGDPTDLSIVSRLIEAGADKRNGALVYDPFRFSPGRLVVPMFRTIYLDDQSTRIGTISMTLDTGLIARNLSEYAFDGGSEVYVGMGDSIFQIGRDHSFSEIRDTSFANLLFAAAKNSQDKNAVSFDLNENGLERTFVVYRGAKTQWTVYQSIPVTRIPVKADTYFNLLLFVAACVFVMIMLIMFTVDRTINTPIKLINKRLEAISGGNFKADPAIEFRNELGDIGRGINLMSRNIESLIASKINDEATKKDLEFKILQNQINPHFLYNTLSSIKWMAEIQKVPGIAEMAGSLAVLLKHLSKGTDELISIEQELALLAEYCTIQEYRSGNMAKTVIEVDDKELLGYGIIKFTLQPIVENAIVHGIEPTRKPGTIVIRVSRVRGDMLSIEVRDNGRGIDAATLPRILDEPVPPNEQSFNHIGLKNVDERIRLRFGRDFGLRIDSSTGGSGGSFTSVRILLPLVVLHHEQTETHRV